eukprot:1110821-Prymnesium_polylepis.1
MAVAAQEKAVLGQGKWCSRSAGHYARSGTVLAQETPRSRRARQLGPCRAVSPSPRGSSSTLGR